MVRNIRDRAVVFDFGGVLITTIANQIGKVAADLGVPTAELHHVLLGPRTSTPDHPWHRAERGEIAVSSIQSELEPWAQQAGIELRGDEIERLLAPGEYTIVEPMVRRVEALRSAGVRTGLLTNTFAEFRPTMERDLDLTLFDAVIESFAVGARKPEAAIYAATVEAVGVDHADVIYLDDFEQNLDPARSLGWTTILVSDPLEALIKLDEVLGAGGNK